MVEGGHGEQNDAAPRVSIGRLPGTGPDLFGREAELAWLDTCWHEGAAVVAVVAFGGVGKTALVNKWLAGLHDDGWRGAKRVFGWSFYSQGTDRLSSSDLFIATALRWFGDPDPTAGSAWERGERLAEIVGAERSLLVLDGVEPLQWGPGVQEGRFKDPGIEALLKGLAAQSAGMCLVSTRIGLVDLDRFRGGKVRSRDLGTLSEEAGAALLRARGLKGTDDELREASREYKGHGLALTLLGSYLEDVASGDVRRRREIGALENDERQGSHARRVMDAYGPWLGGAERSILHMIGLFDRPAEEGEIGALRAEPPIPGFTETVTEIHPSDWNRALAKLRRVGLLLPDEQDKRLDAHPLVRDHFGVALKQSQPEAWREGHRRLYEHLKASTKELPETIEEMQPLYAAVVHGCLAGNNKGALDEVHWKRIRREREAYSWSKLGAFGSEAAVLSAFFAPPWERLAPGLPEAYQAFVLNEAGFALRALGRLPEAAGLMRLGMEMRIAQQDWKNAAISATNLSELHQVHGDLSEALAQARKSVELADTSGDAFQRMITRSNVAAALHAMGRREEAAAQFEEAERIQAVEQPTYPRLYSLPGCLYCDLLLEQGRDAEARVRTAQFFAWRTPSDSLLTIALDHLSIGRAHLLASQHGSGGDLDQAASHLAQAVDGLRRAGTQHNLPLGLLARAALHIHTRDFAHAHKDLAEALSLSERSGFRLHEADAHLGYARLHLAEGHPEQAKPHLDTARRLITETGYHRRDEELAQLERDLAASTTTGTIVTLPLADVRGSENIAALTTTTVPADLPPSPKPSIAMPQPITFPPPLLAAYATGTLGVLVGSGLSLARDVTGGFPTWSELPRRVLAQIAALGLRDATWVARKAASLEGSLPLDDMLAELDTLKVPLESARKYQAAVNAIFRPKGAAPGDVHAALAGLGVDLLATTNYDELIEETTGPRRTVYTWKEADKALSDIGEGRRVLFKIHGNAAEADTLVMTRREYDDVAEDPGYQRILGQLLQSHTFLLLGYGINDPHDLDLVLRNNAKAFGAASRTNYALMHKDAAAPHADRWQRELNIQVITYSDHADLPAHLRALGASKANPP